MQELLDSLIADGMSEDDARLQLEDALKQAKAAEEKRRARAEEIATELYNELGARKQRRTRKEEEWRRAILQYNGKYSAETLAQLSEKGGCQLFLNITRPKTDSFSATLAEKLLPTDEENWALEPTPIAELDDIAQSTQQVDTTPEGAPVQAQDVAQGLQETAKKRCAAMERQIADYLAECDYNAEQRRAIEYGALLGTIILRGPTKAAASAMKWDKSNVEGQDVWMLVPNVKDERPSAEAVDPHHFYPDDTAVEADIDSCSDVYETFFFTKKRLRAMAKSGFDPVAIKESLDAEASALPTWFMNLHADSKDSNIPKGLYEVWLWSGELEVDKLADLGLPEEAVAALDPELDTYPAQVWGIGTRAIKVSLNPSDTGDLPYSAMQVIRDSTNFFGHGVPWAGENAQEGINGAFRMLNDNAGLAVGPQCAINKAMIQGADNDYQMKPRKTWYITNPDDADAPADVRAAIQFFEVQGHMKELMELLTFNMELFDKEMNFNLIMQGGADQNTPDTKGATQILYNTGNTTVHRVVKQYDDRITTPMLKRFYHHEMQHGTKADIKGDYCVIAKGSGVLMERQEQIQAMSQTAQIALAPQYAHIVDQDVFIEQWMKNLRLTGVLRNEQDRAKKLKEMQEQQANAPQGDPARMAAVQVQAQKVKQDGAIAQAELQQRAKEHEDGITLEAKRLFKDMQDSGMGIDQAYQKLGIEKQKVGLTAKQIDSNNVKFNTEIAAKMQTGRGI